MSDVGKYLKILLLPVTVYMFVALVSYGNSYTITNIVTPPSGGFFSYVKWIGSAVGAVIGAAIQTMTFAMLPDPLRIPLTIIFGSMFIYGLIGLIASIVKLVKPF